MICFKESISRSLDHRPVTAYHLSLFFSFSSSSFFLFFFFFFFFLFFCPIGEKKRSFFSSLAVLFLDQSQDGLENSGRHAEDSLEHLLFVFIFQKVFAFVLIFFFLLMSYKSKNDSPFHLIPLAYNLTAMLFSPLFFFSWITHLWIFGSSVLRLWKHRC